MSSPAPLRPIERGDNPRRPQLRLVATRGRPLVASRVAFAVLVGTILGVGLVTLLLLHTLAAQDAFRLVNLQQREAALSDNEQQLALLSQQQQAPSSLAARARALGMVPTGSIAFIKVGRHGKLVGVAHAAPSPPPPPSPTPSASASASPNASTSPNASSSPQSSASSRPSAAAKPPARHRRAATHHRR